jgi:hypothetical protein
VSDPQRDGIVSCGGSDHSRMGDRSRYLVSGRLTFDSSEIGFDIRFSCKQNLFFMNGFRYLSLTTPVKYAKIVG